MITAKHNGGRTVNADRERLKSSGCAVIERRLAVWKACGDGSDGGLRRVDSGWSVARQTGDDAVGVGLGEERGGGVTVGEGGGHCYYYRARGGDLWDELEEVSEEEVWLRSIYGEDAYSGSIARCPLRGHCGQERRGCEECRRAHCEYTVGEDVQVSDARKAARSRYNECILREAKELGVLATVKRRKTITKQQNARECIIV